MKYTVLIEQVGGEIELRLRELPIVVRAGDLATAHELMRNRVAGVLGWAATVGLLDDLPPPLAMPPLDTSLPSPDDLDEVLESQPNPS